MWWPPRRVWLGWERGGEGSGPGERRIDGNQASLRVFEVPESVSKLGESLEAAGRGRWGMLPLGSESRYFLDGIAFEFGLTLLVLTEANRMAYFSAAREMNSAWPVVVR